MIADMLCSLLANVKFPILFRCYGKRALLILPMLLISWPSLAAQPDIPEKIYRLDDIGYGKLWLPSAAGSPSTLVILAHGNGYSLDDYRFLVKDLVALGYAVACVSSRVDSGIKERAQDILNHLDYLYLNFPTELARSVVIIGHSRGGEAALHAANSGSDNYFIRAVISMAPSYEEELVALSQERTASLLVLYASHDADVTGQRYNENPMASPFALYDMAFPGIEQSNRKALFFIQGGSHAGFSDDEYAEDTEMGYQGFLPTADQRLITRELIKWYLQWIQVVDEITQPQLDNPISYPELSDSYKSLFRDKSSHLIADFEGDEPFIGMNDLTVYQDYHFRIDRFSPHLGSGLSITWNGKPGKDAPKLVLSTRESGRYFHGAVYLSFNVAQKYLDQNNQEGTSQDFHIRLVTNNSNGEVRLGDWTQITYPNKVRSDLGDFTINSMSTVRIPLEAFGLLKNSDLLQIELVFDIPRSDGQSRGSLILDDFCFSR